MASSFLAARVLPDLGRQSSFGSGRKTVEDPDEDGGLSHRSQPSAPRRRVALVVEPMPAEPEDASGCLRTRSKAPGSPLGKGGFSQDPGFDSSDLAARTAGVGGVVSLAGVLPRSDPRQRRAGATALITRPLRRVCLGSA